MEDAVMLGVIAVGLGFYNLYLQWKWNRMMHVMQVMLYGIYAGEVEVEELKTQKGALYVPIPKK
jgi:hypothetical protein